MIVRDPSSTAAGRDPATVERRAAEIGREILAELNTAGPSRFSRDYVDQRLMEWPMKNEHFKVELFRFIDVLPTLTTDDAVAEHIQAYFGHDNAEYPWVVRQGAKVARPGTFAGRRAARVARSQAEHMARRFIAGSEPDEVVASVRKLRERGMTFTMDLLGEAVVTEAEADDYQHQYLELLAALGAEAATWDEHPVLDRDADGPMPRVNLSIKVSALNSQFDAVDPAGSYETVARRLRPIFREAVARNAIINFDMEHYATKDLTLYCFRRILMEPEFRDWPHVGLALQAYLVGAERDVRGILDFARKRGTPVWVRLVKGAYWDYETVHARKQRWPVPVWQQKWQSDACFERCTRILMENFETLRPAIASHNVRSISHALALAEYLEAPRLDYELQTLYGMGDELKDALVRRGERVRVYTPFGQLLPGMAYLVRRLLENTSNTSFLRQTYVDHSSIDRLLRSPTEVAADPATAQLDASSHGESMNGTHVASGSAENLSPFVNEPYHDFTGRLVRDEMAGALRHVRSGLPRHCPLFIGGREIETDETIASVNPSDTSETIGTTASASADHARQAVEAADAARKEWARTPVQRRAGKLLELAGLMRARRGELAATMILECGKQWREADADVAEAIDFCEYYARHALQLDASRERNVPGEDNEYFYVPRGVTAVITPWNFPLAIPTGMAVAPLVAGNPIVFKPAEQSGITAGMLFGMMRQVGFPDGVVNFLPGVGETVGPVLVEHPATAVITFTGSVAVGLAINEAAAKRTDGQRHVKRVIAEMGGKNAVIIDDDADLDEAVKGVVASAFGFQGQKCSACSRVIVLPRVYDAFVERLKQATASIAVGPTDDPRYQVGPVIDEDSMNRLNEAIERGKQENTLLYAGDVSDLSGKGHYVAPHVFTDVKPDDFLAQTEFFGPLLAVIRAADIDEALDIANDTKYALTGGIFSRNPHTLARVRREFEVGNLYVNRRITGAEVDRQPFGGFRLSGIGAKAGGPDYLLQFMVPRTVTENTLRRGFAPEDD